MRFIIFLCLTCLAVASYGQSPENNDQSIPTGDAWQAVLQGKAVILMRHAIAPGTGDPENFNLEDCDTQRNLSEEGRSQAIAIGDVLRANGIEEARLLSSQWCRCMETAELLDFGQPEPAAMLNSFFQQRESQEERMQALKNSLTRWRSEPAEVRILVTHQVNISALTGQGAGSGEMLIVTMEEVPVVLETISPQ